MKTQGIWTTLTVLLCLVAVTAVSAQEKKRSKVIDFEDEVVEGMNRKPLDSLSQISEAQKNRRKPHLYRKRVGFRTETAETLHAMKFTQ